MPFVAYAADVFPGSRPARPALAERLLDMRVSIHRSTALPEMLAACDELLAEYHSITQKVETFIGAARQEMVDRLEKQHASVWDRCRMAEDNLKAATLEISRLNGTLSTHASELGAARARAREAAQKYFDSKYPTNAELNSWNSTKAAAQSAFEIVEKRHQEIGRELSFAEVSLHDSKNTLAELEEQLRQIDEQLAALKKEI